MKFKVDITDNTMHVETACSVSEMLTAVTAIVSNLYESLAADPVLREYFKFALTEAFKDGLPFADKEEKERLAAAKLKETEEAAAKYASPETRDAVNEAVEKLIRAIKGDPNE